MFDNNDNNVPVNMYSVKKKMVKMMVLCSKITGNF